MAPAHIFRSTCCASIAPAAWRYWRRSAALLPQVPLAVLLKSCKIADPLIASTRVLLVSGKRRGPLSPPRVALVFMGATPGSLAIFAAIRPIVALAAFCDWDHIPVDLSLHWERCLFHSVRSDGGPTIGRSKWDRFYHLFVATAFLPLT